MKNQFAGKQLGKRTSDMSSDIGLKDPQSPVGEPPPKKRATKKEILAVQRLYMKPRN